MMLKDEDVFKDMVPVGIVDPIKVILVIIKNTDKLSCWWL